MGPVLTQFSQHTEPRLAAENWLNLLRFPTQTRTTLILFAQLIQCPFMSYLCDLLSPVGLSGVVTSSI